MRSNGQFFKGEQVRTNDGRVGLILDDFPLSDPPPSKYQVLFSGDGGKTLSVAPITFDRTELEVWDGT